MKMLVYQKVEKCDNELVRFHQCQKEYYALEGTIVTRNTIVSDMCSPQGFENHRHEQYKIYDGINIIGYIDFIYGYRFSQKHDHHYVWIGLFLIDENHQRKHYGKQIIDHFINIWKNECDYIQLGCLIHNRKGYAFWKSLGFYDIDISSDQEVLILEKHIDKEKHYDKK